MSQGSACPNLLAGAPTVDLSDDPDTIGILQDMFKEAIQRGYREPEALPPIAALFLALMAKSLPIRTSSQNPRRGSLSLNRFNGHTIIQSFDKDLHDLFEDRTQFTEWIEKTYHEIAIKIVTERKFHTIFIFLQIIE